MLFSPGKSRVVPGFRALLFGPQWDRAQIEEFQARRLRALILHAYQRVPYYQRLFDKVGLKPDDIRTPRDLGRIPTTTRRDLQTLPDSDIVARGFDPKGLVTHRTSGSSGQPLNIRRTLLEDRLLQAIRLRALFQLGLRIRDRRVAVVKVRHAKTPISSMFGLLRYEEVDCLLPPERILERLRITRPNVLRGYSGVLHDLAGFVTDADRERIRPRFIATGAETLTGEMRSRISDAFGAKVIDFYGSHEFNMIASECPASGVYHACDATVIAEVVAGERAVDPSEEGEFVGTALHSWAMPLIRYRLGDLVTRGPERCPCGAANSTIARVQGRVADQFEFPDGRRSHPYIIANPLLTHARWVRQYQLIQEQPDRIRVKLAPLPGLAPSPESIEELRRILVEKLGSDVTPVIEIVDSIPADPSGKFRPYYSLSSPPRGGGR